MPPLLRAGQEERPGSGRENLRVRGRRSSCERKQTKTQKRGRRGQQSGGRLGLLPGCPPVSAASGQGRGPAPRGSWGSVGFRGALGRRDLFACAHPHTFWGEGEGKPARSPDLQARTPPPSLPHSAPGTSFTPLLALRCLPAPSDAIHPLWSSAPLPSQAFPMMPCLLTVTFFLVSHPSSPACFLPGSS